MRKFKRWFHTYQVFIISAAAILFSILAIVFVIVPAIQQIRVRITETQQLSRDTDVLRQKLTILGAFDEETLKLQLAEMVAALPTDKSLPTLFSTVDGVTNQSSTILTDLEIVSYGSVSTSSAVTSKVKSNNSGSNIMEFTLDAEGTLDAVKQLFAQIIYARRLLRVKFFSINITDTDQVKVRIDTEAFYAAFPKLNPNTPLSAFTQKELQDMTDIQAIPLLGQDAVLTGGDGGLPSQTKVDPFSP